MGRRLGAAAAGLLVALLAAPAAALCGDGAASEDLTNECLVRAFEGARPAGRTVLGPVLARRLTQAGLDAAVGLPRPVRQPAARIAIRPLLEYSSNLNGGQTDQAFRIGGLDFLFAEAERRRAGLTIGAEIAAAQRLLPGGGQRLDLFGSAAASHAPAEGFAILRGQLGACHAWRAGQGTLLSGCLTGFRLDRALATTDVVVQSLRYTRFAATGPASTAFKLGVERRLEDGLDQKTLRLGAETILPGDVVAEAGIGFGRFGAGAFGISRSLDLDLTAPVAGRTARLAYAQARQDGATLFGQARVDRLRTLSVQVSVTRRAAVELGYVRRDSTIATFDESYPTIGVTFAAIAF